MMVIFSKKQLKEPYMRRSQNEIAKRTIIDEVIRSCDVLRVGMSVDNIPYIVPMNFGYDEKSFYCHCAREGRKLDMLAVNPNVCFELDTDHNLVAVGEEACKWTMTYTSVMGMGTMTTVTDPAQKAHALNLIMAQYGGKTSGYEYPDKMLEATVILRLDITEITGKKK